MLISIVVPVYNAEPFLSKCVASLLNQTHRDIEVILINDGSTDKSLDICKNFTMIDKRVKTIAQKNQGQSVARNLGIDIAKGKYIMFADADDFCEHDIVSSLLKVIESKKVGLAICSYTSHLFDRNKELMSSCLKVDSQKLISVKSLLDFDVQSNYQVRNYEMSTIWGRLYIAEIIKKNNLRFNPLLSKFEDIEFNMLYLSHIDNIFILDRSLYHYHVSTSSKTISDKINTGWFDMITSSYNKICNAFIGKKIDYLNFYYSSIFMGYLIRLFQVGSPVKFKEAVSEVKKVANSAIFKKCMKYYRRPDSGSRLFPFFLKLHLFFLAGLTAKIRMLKAFYGNKPIRKWCFSKNTK